MRFNDRIVGQIELKKRYADAYEPDGYIMCHHHPHCAYLAEYKIVTDVETIFLCERDKRRFEARPILSPNQTIYPETWGIPRKIIRSERIRQT